MNQSVYDLKKFYGTRGGRLVRRFLNGHVREIWPDVKDLRVMGCGYALPFLQPFQAEADRVFAVMPAHGGVHHWPENGAGKVCLAEDDLLPLETESVDRIIMVHGLEFSQNPTLYLQEIWRVLRSNGRILVVVPNRMGLWARADWTPFGHGTPYSAGQVTRYLEECLFVHERTERALFMPPFRSFGVLRTAYALEGAGHYLFPGLAGVHLIEASKRVYAGHPQKKIQRPKRVLVAKPVMTG